MNTVPEQKKLVFIFEGVDEEIIKLIINTLKIFSPSTRIVVSQSEINKKDIAICFDKNTFKERYKKIKEKYKKRKKGEVSYKDVLMFCYGLVFKDDFSLQG